MFYDYSEEAFAERVAEKREQKGLTQKNLAHIAGCKVSTIQRLEARKDKGKQSKIFLSAGTLGRLADILNTSTDYLLFGENSLDELVSDFNKAQYDDFDLAKKQIGLSQQSFDEGLSLEDIPERLTRLRTQENLTQQALAKKLGYKNKSTIGRIEDYLRELNTNQSIRYAQYFHVSTHYIITGRIGQICSLYDRELSVLRYDSQLKLIKEIKRLTESK